MPNWCEGIMKIRGTKENVAKFFKEGVHTYNWGRKADNSDAYEIDSDGLIVDDSDKYMLDVIIKNDAYIEGTSRAFILSDYYDMCFEYNDEPTICIFGFKQAWGIRADEFVPISKKYNLDFRFNGYEGGMCFEELVEIINGEITKDETIEYEDWNWECPRPDLGG